MKKLITPILLLLFLNISAQEVKFGKVSKEELQEEFYPLDSSANAAYLYKSRKTFYRYNQNKGFRIVNQVHLRLKIYNKDGADNSTQRISFVRPTSGEKEQIKNLKGYSYNLNSKGKIEKDKISKKNIFTETVSKYRSVKKVTFPNVNKGTVIELRYELVSPYTSYIDDLNFQSNIPCKNFYAKVEIPEWYTFKKLSKGYYTIPLKTLTRHGNISFSQRVRRGARVVTRSDVQTSKIDLKYNVDIFEAKNIPALKDNEPYVANIKNYYGGIKYELEMIYYPDSQPKTFTNSWKKVATQIYKAKSFGGELEKKSYFKEDLKSILENTSSDIEKTIAIFQFVKKKVKWNEYFSKYSDLGVKKAYKEGSGNVADINLMLTAMLREAKLNANPVLVSTKSNGAPIFPTLDGFNYVISMVEFPNGTYALLDATEPYSIPNILPTRALNWKGRKITIDGNSSWINLTSKKPALEEVTINIKLTEDGDVSGLLRRKLDNLNALVARKNYNSFKDEDIRNKLEEKYNIEIESFRISNKHKLSKPYSLSAKFSSDNLVEELNDKLYIEPLLFLTTKTNPFKLEDRKFPVDYSSPWKDSHMISIQIPDGYKVESIPQKLAIGLPENLGVFKFQITNTGNKVKVLSIMEIKSAILAPQYYQALKEFYRQIVAKQNEKIVLSKQ